MNIYINIYWIRVRIFTENKSLFNMINKYYELFLTNKLDNIDIDIRLVRYSYFQNKNEIELNKHYLNIWDSVKISWDKSKYFFKQQEISWLLDFSDESKISVIWKLIPHKIRHLIHISLQWLTRIDKFYNRFIIKTCIHDIIFILLEKKYKTCILHATAVTNWEKTFLFTGLWWSWKSTLASAFSQLKWYTILSDNYSIISWNKLLPFPELPRITKWTQKLLWINLHKKADWIKNYLENDTKNIKKDYEINWIFICSYWEKFNLEKLTNNNDIFEYLYSINNYTKEFPEYLNLSLLSIIWKFNTNNQRIDSLKELINSNKIFSLENNSELELNLDKIDNV